MTEKATGYFESEVDRQPPYDDGAGAIERFTGALNGRRGSFILQYGFTGTLSLNMVDGKQYYTLAYTS